MVREMTIALRSTDAVRKFVNEASTIKAEIELISGGSVVNAKSILGIYSLDLSKPIELVIRGDCSDCLEVLEKYRI